MAKLTENVQRAMQVEPVQDRDGNPTGQYIYQGGVANRALELLGKELGMFQPKPEKDQGLEIHELMARLNAGRDRWRRRSGRGMRPLQIPQICSVENQNIRGLSAPKRMAPANQSRTWPIPPVSSVRLLSLARKTSSPGSLFDEILPSSRVAS
jgi:hypothetical protein